MKTFECEALYDGEHWLRPAFVTVDQQGTITSLAESGRADEKIRGYVLPGFQNAHSHAFQYAMAGLAECIPPPGTRDNFWTWREAMYSLALNIQPDAMRAVASILYAEMLRQGCTAVVEFHYMHNDCDGKPYQNRAELAECILDAAEIAGIDLTLVPVYYRQGDFDTPPSERQRRFLSRDTDDYWKLWEASKIIAGKKGFRMGAGVHSLRAASPADVRGIFGAAPAGIPLHMHIAEQTGEVERCKETRGTTPVHWLFDNVAVNENYFLVHATHMTEAETLQLAQSKATVVLCPTTEANLGDGIFPAQTFLAEGGNFTTGSDSQVGLYTPAELRLVESAQRLTRRERNILCLETVPETGERLFRTAWCSGRRARGAPGAKDFLPGESFDAAVIDPDYPLFVGAADHKVLSKLVFASDSSALLGTLRRGQWLVRRGEHLRHAAILAEYRRFIP